MADSKSKSRLVEVDALRGLAALAVVLFHYTTRFTELFAPNPPPTFSFPDGHYGVNLFFIISGFVIFMTLEKTSRPMDFVVSRFSRLFPAYWVAIILTLSITHLLGLPVHQSHRPVAWRNRAGGEYLATPVSLALDANRSSPSRAIRSGRRRHLNCRLDKPQ